MTFENCYNVETYVANEDKSYDLTWAGHTLSSYDCQFIFRAYNSDHPKNDYKVCIQATVWSILDTQVKLKYYAGSEKSIRKVYN